MPCLQDVLRACSPPCSGLCWLGSQLVESSFASLCPEGSLLTARLPGSLRQMSLSCKTSTQRWLGLTCKSVIPVPGRHQGCSLRSLVPASYRGECTTRLECDWRNLQLGPRGHQGAVCGPLLFTQPTSPNLLRSAKCSWKGPPRSARSRVTRLER